MQYLGKGYGQELDFSQGQETDKGVFLLKVMLQVHVGVKVITYFEVNIKTNWKYFNSTKI